MREDIRKSLLLMKDDKLKAFSEKLIPGQNYIIGIRLPELRKMAKQLARTGNMDILNEKDIYYEEKMLRGMLIGYLKIPDDLRFQMIREFIPQIDNWGVCDSFCSTLTFTRKCLPEMREFLTPCIRSEKEFEQRFAAVMLKCFYINDDYIADTLESLANIHTDAYYSSMAVAWTMSECFIHYPEQTQPYLQDNRLDIPTHNRTIQKICDSYRVSDAQKNQLKQWIRRQP